MRKVTIFLWSCLILGMMTSSCRKECRYVSVGSVNCSKGYSQDYNFKYKAISSEPLKVPTNQVIVINDDSTYQAMFPKNSLGTVNFKSNSLIGVCVVTNMGSSYESQGAICKKNDGAKWKYTVKYSVKDQCKGSGISRMYLSAWEIGPKLPPNAVIDLEIIDVNPM